MDKQLYEEKVMSLIVAAGACRSQLMEAIRSSREGEFDKADALLGEAQKQLVEAHSIQTQLIEYDEGEGKLPVHIVMVHAQDHVMNAVLLSDIAKELIYLHRRLPA